MVSEGVAQAGKMPIDAEGHKQAGIKRKNTGSTGAEDGHLYFMRGNSDGELLVDDNKLRTSVGTIGDAVVAAGAGGSLHAQMRRLTTDLAAQSAKLPAVLVGGRLDVVVGAALPAGANAIGKLAANSGVDIGDVDVTSVPADPFGTNASAIVAAGAAGDISAKLRRATQGLEDLKSLIVLAAGANLIGAVDTELPAARLAALGLAFPTAPDVLATQMLSNLTTLDPETGNVLGTVLASAARTTTTAATIVNVNCVGLIIWVNITVAPGGGEFIQPQIQVIDPVSGQNPVYWTAVANLTVAPASYIYLFYPGATSPGGGNITQFTAAPVPRNISWRMNHSGAGSWTYSVGYGLIR